MRDARSCSLIIGGGPVAAAPAERRPRPRALRDRSRRRWAGQAFANAISVYSLEWTPFGAAEMGLGDLSAADAAGAGHRLRAEHAGLRRGPGGVPGALRPAADRACSTRRPSRCSRACWQERRPFVMARVRDECPEPPPLRQLGYLVAPEEHADRLTRLLRRDVLDAYRRHGRRRPRRGARRSPTIRNCCRSSPASATRRPTPRAAPPSGNCDGLRRAVCSPHRTGTAVDLYVGQLLGMGVDSTDPASRQHMTQGADLSLAGRERRPVRLRALCLRALALGVGRSPAGYGAP